MDGAGAKCKTSETFVFQAKVFRIADAYFARADNTGNAVFHLPLGGCSASLPLTSIRAEFNIDSDSEDGRLLCRVEQALRYVQQVRHGDSLPREIIDGSASWKFAPQHLMIARGRLWHALLVWAGLETQLELQQSCLVSYAGGEAVVAQRGAVLERLQGAAGKTTCPVDQIEKMLEAVAREYAFIEALFAHFRDIFDLRLRFACAGEKYGGTADGVAEYGRIVALCQEPLRKAHNSFKVAKTLIGDPPALVLAHDRTVEALRELRDDLHREAEKWRPLAEKWRTDPGDEQGRVERRRDTYRFLAQNWARGENWGNLAEA